jgi:hypothetical protein
MSLLESFCAVDDFWQAFAPGFYTHQLQTGALQRHRTKQLTTSEVITIVICLHSSPYRTFKACYTEHACRKRALLETIKDQLKNQAQIEHSRQRSLINFLVNLVAGLVAYCHPLKKPSLRFGTGTASVGGYAVIPN